MSTRKIDAWHEAGLIDAETRSRLIAYEDEHARPLALWAVFGIGALTIGLGLISLVAANWEDVPGQVRLAIHLALILGGVGALFFREERMASSSPWLVEALVFVLAVLGLTFFGHIGQVYQTSSPLWEPLAWWLVLFAPLMLISGRGWPIAALLFGGAAYCAWEYVSHVGGIWTFGRPKEAPFIWLAAVNASPVLLGPVAAYLRERSTRPDFWRRLEQLALTYAVLGASVMAALASVGAYGSDDLEFLDPASQFTRAAIAFVAGGLIVVARPGISGQMSGAIMAGAALVTMIAPGVSDVDLLAAALFMGLWLAIAGASLKAGWRGVFQFAVAVIAIRLIVLSFELASDLLLSGFGLILSGILILVIAWAAYRVSSSFAPTDAEEAV